MKNNGPVFLVILLASVVIIVLIAVMEGKKDYEQLEKIEQTVSSADASAEEIGNAIDATTEMMQSEYDNLDEAIQ